MTDELLLALSNIQSTNGGHTTAKHAYIQQPKDDY